MKRTPFDPRIKLALDRGLTEVGDTVDRLKAIESEGGANLSMITRALLVVKALTAVTARVVRSISAALIEKANDDEVGS